MGANNTFNPDDYSGSVSAAETAARAAGGAIVLSSGKTYTISSPVTLDWNNAYIGCPSGTAVLTSASSSGDLIILGNSTTGVVVENLHITRGPLGVASACGIRQNLGALSQARLENLRVTRQGVGVFLSGTNYSEIRGVTSSQNTSHGFHFYLSSYSTVGVQSGPGQWYWAGQNLAEYNGGSGMLIQSAPGATFVGGTSVGTITNFATFHNGAYGIVALGTAALPLHAIRMVDCFVGEDALDEIYFDTYGADHIVANTYVEIGFSRGIHFSPNNSKGMVTNSKIVGNNGIGLALQGGQYLVSACDISNNGGPGGTGNAWGIYSSATKVVVNGCIIGNPAAGVGYKQNIGINGVGGSMIVSGCDLGGNNTVPYTGATAFTFGPNFY